MRIRVRFLLSLGVAFSGSCMFTGGEIGSSKSHLVFETLSMEADTYVTSTDPDSNYGTDTLLQVRDTSRALLQVSQSDLLAVTGGLPVLSATVKLVGNGSPELHRLTLPWEELAATWHCPADSLPGDMMIDCIDPPGPWVGPGGPSFVATPAVFNDVTADVNAFISGDASNFGWAVVDEGAKGFIHSRESEYGATLQLVLADPTYVPAACSAPELDDSRITRVADVVAHIHSGLCPVQSGLSATVLDPARASHLQGRVIDGAGVGLAGVTVRIRDRAELGWTRTRADGRWDLVVNGGGSMVVDFLRTETASWSRLLPVQRELQVPTNDYAVLDDVVMLEPQALAGCMSVGAGAAGYYESPVETDSRGTRHFAVYIPSGVTVTDGSGAAVPRPFYICGLEYTVDRAGGSGAQAMPAVLPPTSAFTFAAELELRDGGGDPVDQPTFSAPVYVYVEDFLGFPVSDTHVPSGAYDAAENAWTAEDDGRVVALLADGSGNCAFDRLGDGVPNFSGYGTGYDVTPAELLALGSCTDGLGFDAGDTVWRVPLSRFSPHDWNWAVAFATGALFPFLEWAFDGSPQGSCDTGGSIIGCEGQTLGELVPITGTPWALHYQSERQRGRRDHYAVRVRIGGTPIGGGAPVDPLRTEVRVQIAGTTYAATIDPVTGGLTGDGTYDPVTATYELFWDGYDTWGRLLQGAQPATVHVGNVYTAEYATSSSGSGPTFELPGDASVSVGAGEFILWAQQRRLIGGWDEGAAPGGFVRGRGLAGWSITPHHVYDALQGVLYRGDGTRLSTRGMQPQIDTLYDGSTSVIGPRAVTVAPDGTVYFGAGHAVYRIPPGGSAGLYAGSLTVSGGTDGVHRLDARFWDVEDLAVTRSGDVLVLESAGNRLRRIRDDVVEMVVSGLSSPRQMAIGPTGTVFIADYFNNRVRAWNPTGGAFTYYEDSTSLYRPTAITVDARGYVLVAARDNSIGQNVIQRVAPAGTGSSRVVRVAGGGSCAARVPCVPRDMGDGGLATDACLDDVRGLWSAYDGALFIADDADLRVRRITPQGTIETVAGTGVSRTCTDREGGDGGPARAANFTGVHDVTLGPDGRLYIADDNDWRIRVVEAALPDAVVGESIVQDGSVLHRFDERGRHTRTENALTGETLLNFDYVIGTGRLDAIWSPHSDLRLTVVRDGGKQPARLVSAYGDVTDLGLNLGGYLDTITDPGATATHTLTYWSGAGQDGLLRWFDSPLGRWTLTYDENGRLTQDQSPLGFDHLDQRMTRLECGSGLSCAPEQMGWQVVHDFHDGGVAVWRPRRNTVIHQAGITHRTVESPLGARSTWRSGDLDDGSLSAPISGGSESLPVVLLSTDPGGTVMRAAFGPDPRVGFDPYVRALEVVRPSGVTTNVTVTRSHCTSGCPGLPFVQDTVAVGSRQATLLAEIDATSSACRERRTVTTPLGHSAVACLDTGGRLTSLASPGLNTVSIFHDPSTGRPQVITQGARELRLDYRAPATGTDQWWLGSADLIDGVSTAERLEVSRNLQGFATGLMHENIPLATSSTIGLTPDLVGRILTITPPAGYAHDHAYSTQDALSTYTPPMAGGTRPGILNVPAFDPAHRPEQVRILDGGALTHQIDLKYEPTFGYLSRMDLPGGRAVVITRNTTIDPDTTPADGRVSTLTLDVTTLSYAYDGTVLTSEAWSGAAVAGSVGRSVDTYGELDGLFTLVGGATSCDPASPSCCARNDVLCYAHDDDGRVIDADGMTIGYALAGAPTRWQRTTALASVSTTETLNGYGELDDLALTYGGASRYHYEVTARDYVGREVTRSETLDGTTQMLAYEYDGEGRLAAVTLDGGVVASYGYDLNGNRAVALHFGVWVHSGRPKLGDLQYDEQDRLLATEACSYTYTTWGALETSDCFGGFTEYQYDVLGNLLSVTLPSGDVVAYDVDALGRRVRRRYLAGGTTVTSEQRYLYAGGLNPVAELDSSNNLVKVFVYATRLNVPDYLIDVAGGGIVYRYVTDPRGSVRQVINASTGVPAQELRYDAFGFVLSETGAGFQPFGFAGGIWDADTGLVRFGARDYDPTIGRWTAKDPALFRGIGTNLYEYGLSDPINRVDPDGREPVSIVVLGTAVVLGAGLINGGLNALQQGSSIGYGRAFGNGFIGGAAGALAGFLSGNPILAGAVAGAVSNGLTTGLNLSSPGGYGGVCQAQTPGEARGEILVAIGSGAFLGALGGFAGGAAAEAGAFNGILGERTAGVLGSFGGEAFAGLYNAPAVGSYVFYRELTR